MGAAKCIAAGTARTQIPYIRANNGDDSDETTTTEGAPTTSTEDPEGVTVAAGPVVAPPSKKYIYSSFGCTSAALRDCSALTTAFPLEMDCLRAIVQCATQ